MTDSVWPKAQLKKFKERLEAERKGIVFNDRIIREDYFVNVDDRFDEVDQAASDSAQSMRMRLSNREVLYLRKIQEALRRLEEGVFGMCESCSEKIEMRRLLARPTVTFCVSCKEEQERFESFTAVGRTPKSIGEAFSRKTT